MDNRIFAPAAISLDGEVKLDLNGFVMRLLLFEHYTLDSMLMRELAQMVGIFGVEGLRDLLSADIISIHSSALTLGQLETKLDNEEYGRPVHYTTNEFMPYNNFDFVNIDIPNRREYIDHGLREINKLGYPGKRTAGLKNEILEHLTDIPNIYGYFELMNNALSINGSVAKMAVINATEERGYTPPASYSENLWFEFTKGKDNIISAETNLQELLGIKEYDEHKLLERAMLSVGGFYQRLSFMKAYDSIAWFSDNDSNLFRTELARVSAEIRSNVQEDRMTRVLELKGLPTLTPDSYIDVSRIMKMRDSPECREFRDWLKTNDAKSDEDIKREIGSFYAAFANAFGTTRSKAARFVLGAAIGAVNPPAGMVLGIIDQFVVDKILKRNGPVWFINNELPKLGNPY